MRRCEWIVRSPSKRRKRCLPWASTAVTARPASFSRPALAAQPRARVRDLAGRGPRRAGGCGARRSGSCRPRAWAFSVERACRASVHAAGSVPPCDDLERIVGADHVAARRRRRRRGGRGVAARALVRPAARRRSPRSSPGATSATSPIVPVGGRSGLAGRRGRARRRGGRDRAGPPARGALASTRCCGGCRPRRASRRTRSRGCARENGLCFPPDPGAPEQSQLGGTIATNAGGPHCLQVRRDRATG